MSNFLVLRVIHIARFKIHAKQCSEMHLDIGQFLVTYPHNCTYIGGDKTTSCVTEVTL